MSPAELAQRNLDLVVAAVGAVRKDGYYELYLDGGKRKFLVQPEQVFIQDHTQRGTCLQLTHLPEEQIATVLLLLKNDPDIFNRWRNQPFAPWGA